MSWLSSIKLSVAQWLGASAALIVGLLVAALKLQGSRLHKAQTELLREQFGRKMEVQDRAVEQAKARWQKALDEYNDAR